MRRAEVVAVKPERLVVRVPFPDGKSAGIDVIYDPHKHTYGIILSAELIDQAPEAVTAAVQLAFLAVQDHRRRRT